MAWSGLVCVKTPLDERAVKPLGSTMLSSIPLASDIKPGFLGRKCLGMTRSQICQRFNAKKTYFAVRS